MPRHLAATSPRQHVETVVEVLGNLFERQRAHAGHGQLDGQGNAVESIADLRHERCVMRRQLESRMGGGRTLDKKTDRIVRGQLCDRWQMARSG